MALAFQKNDRQQVEKWIGGRKGFNLLYKASTDGCNSGTFHNKCNNKGPTVSLFYNSHGTVYGGYNPRSWTNAGNVNEPNAFIFRLRHNGQPKPVQLKPKTWTGYEYSIHDGSGYGPSFGYHGNTGGYDLLSFSGNINMTGGTYYQMNGTWSLSGHAYNMQNENYNTFANGTNQVTDIEVYEVRERNMDDPLDEPWRRTKDWETRFMQELKEYVEMYKPLSEVKVSQAKILLIGQVGAGKSSFFNTINSIFRGYVTSQACSGSSEHSLTTHYRMYNVRNGGTGRAMNFRLCDTRGLEEDQGLDSHEVCYLLDGNIPDKYMFNPSVPVSADVSGFISSPKLKDKIHVAAFVIDASTIDVMSEKVLERMKSLQLRMNQRGIPQVVLLTKVDQICEPLSHDVSSVFRMPVVQDCVDKVSQVMGLPRAHVLPVKNYESEMELDENINILALLTLQQILHFADDYLYNFLDDIEEEDS
ncbi:hypothetical protein FSP39_014435 [Pinctada imbricata]|uniref:TLDc domain-containing protein n=1 Tax=Pinctada imbricata TaxID=66713 RepID=A0AA88YII6_PINIB|nr:hypothetical protein FSP39_014435 [Pinctada imbricata]